MPVVSPKVVVVGLNYVLGPNLVATFNEHRERPGCAISTERHLPPLAARYPNARAETTIFDDRSADDELDAVGIATPVPPHYGRRSRSSARGGQIRFVREPPAMLAVEMAEVFSLRGRENLVLSPAICLL